MKEVHKLADCREWQLAVFDRGRARERERERQRT